MEIVIGSNSEIKLNAVRNAVSLLKLPCSVSGKNIPSGVPGQPRGIETELGAHNRAIGAWLQGPSREEGPDIYYLGIENGIQEVDGRWVDYAAIVLIHPDLSEEVTRSVSVGIPTEAVMEATNRGPDVTVASILHEWYGFPATDPHSRLPGSPGTREQILTEAMAQLLKPLNTRRFPS